MRGESATARLPIRPRPNQPPDAAIHQMRIAHNLAHQADKTWSYGPEYQRGICATGSFKTPGCPGGGWQLCGSNTYPTGDFPACHSPLDVYDLNGNAAEHMNLPLNEQQMSSLGSKELGYTEMKGSWFIFDTYRAHEDWCRWRAPFWHGTRVMDPASHANYHLGFRCCKTIEPTGSPLLQTSRLSLAASRRRDPASTARATNGIGKERRDIEHGQRAPYGRAKLGNERTESVTTTESGLSGSEQSLRLGERRTHGLPRCRRGPRPRGGTRRSLEAPSFRS